MGLTVGYNRGCIIFKGLLNRLFNNYLTTWFNYGLKQWVLTVPILDTAMATAAA